MTSLVPGGLGGTHHLLVSGSAGAGRARTRAALGKPGLRLALPTPCRERGRGRGAGASGHLRLRQPLLGGGLAGASHPSPPSPSRCVWSCGSSSRAGLGDPAGPGLPCGSTRGLVQRGL